MKNKLIKELKQNIEKQREDNVKLYKSIPTPTKEDPRNEKAEPILRLWREGSNKLKEMVKELQELELAEKESSVNPTVKTNKTFVNGFGEATSREISCIGYERANKRTQKAILSFMGSR